MNDKRYETYTEMYYKKFYKYLDEFLTNDEVPFEAFAKMVVKYKDDRDRVLSDITGIFCYIGLPSSDWDVVVRMHQLMIPLEVFITFIGGLNSTFVMFVV